MPRPEPQPNEALARTLLANPAAFQGFARRRLRDDQLAADSVQESLLRAKGKLPVSLMQDGPVSDENKSSSPV